MKQTPPPLSLFQILLCGALIVTLSMGIRHGFGLWMAPMTQEHGWTRQTFSFAIALQNLTWGICGIFAGMLADKFGAFRVIVVGAFLYSLGLLGMAYLSTPLGLIVSCGVLIGAAQAGTTYAVIYGIIGRSIAAEKRSWAMGVAAAAGSFGQFLMVPTEGLVISAWGWQLALVGLACASLLIVPLAFGLREPGFSAGVSPKRDQSIVQALKEAIAIPSFQLLMLGYFVCGFQVVFIGVHLPSYLKDHAMQPSIANYALALIGLFNVFGTYIAGALGQRFAKRKILACIYFARSIAITLFVLLPLTPISVVVFSSVMGLLWLSTIPPTNSVVAQIFGVQHFSMLSGFVFFSHQIGSFMGVWLGGYVFDATASYDSVWVIAIVLGVVATIANLPINESPLVRNPHTA